MILSEIKFRKIHPNAVAPKQGNEYAVGFDLSLPEDLELPITSNVGIVGFGISIEIPYGFEGQIRGRSSTLSRYGLLIPLGTIDPDYRGELKMDYVWVHNGSEGSLIPAGTRVAQLVISPTVVVIEGFVEGELSNTSRGNGGFGSTGK